MPRLPSDFELIIRPTNSWFRFNLAELWRYRDLLLLLVHRDFVAKYRQTILGPIWFGIQPILMAGMFVLVFSSIADIPTSGVPPMLFYLAGLLGWNYFAQVLQSTGTSLATNAALFGKVYFPRLIVPLSSAISNLFALILQSLVFLACWCYFKFGALNGSLSMTPSAVLFPVFILQIAALSLGVGLWLAALTAKYRDLTHLTAFLIQLWMYATPVIYALSQVPERWRWVVVLNPLAVPIEGARDALLGSGSLRPGDVVWSVGLTLAIAVSGLLVFNKVERTSVDTL